MEYYSMIECPQCGEEVYSKGINGVEHKGLPVFSPDMFSQMFETCPKCEIDFGTGDMEIMTA